MKKRIFAALGMAVVLSIGMLCGCSGGSGQGAEKSVLKFGTAGNGGTYYSYANNLAEQTKDSMELNVRTTAGSAANIRLLRDGFIDIAIAQSDILESAINGTGMFEGAAIKEEDCGFSAVSALYTEALQIVVKADAGIETIGDMDGKSVSVGEEESGVLQNAQQVLQTSGLTFDDIDVHYMSFSDSADAMRGGKLDAFFVTAGAPTAAIADLAEDIDIKLLSLDDSTIKTLEKLYKGYIGCTIPAGTYKGQDEEVATLGVKAVLIASNSLSSETVKALTESLFKFDSKLDIAFATEAVPIDFHQGAGEYYSANGVTVNVNSGSGAGNVFGSQDE